VYLGVDNQAISILRGVRVMGNRLEKAIADAISNELGKYTHTCQFNVTDKEAKEMGFFFRMVSDLGEGHLDNGLELMKENHKWIASQRRIGRKISTWIMYTIVCGMITGVLYMIWEGIKKTIGK
jgi:hypothetical protein